MCAATCKIHIMQTIICIGSGPSLIPDDCLHANDSGLPVIAVNNSWNAVPGCQHIYAADCCWWEEYGAGITSEAARWCGDEFTARRFGINWLPSAIPGSFNSGQRAFCYNNWYRFSFAKGTPGDSEHRGGEDTRKTASFLHFMGFIIIRLTS